MAPKMFRDELPVFINCLIEGSFSVGAASDGTGRPGNPQAAPTTFGFNPPDIMDLSLAGQEVIALTREGLFVGAGMG